MTLWTILGIIWGISILGMCVVFYEANREYRQRKNVFKNIKGRRRWLTKR